MERGKKTQKASVLLLSLLCFVSLCTKGWEAQEIRRFVVFITNDKMPNKDLLQALPLLRFWCCFQLYKSLHYRLMPFQNHFITQT